MDPRDRHYVEGPDGEVTTAPCRIRHGRCDVCGAYPSARIDAENAAAQARH